MDVIYKTDLHRYANVKFTPKELKIAKHFIEYGRLPDGIEIYERDKDSQFIFLDKKIDYNIEELVKYFDYIVTHPSIHLQIRKDKIERLIEFRKLKIDKILKGS